MKRPLLLILALALVATLLAVLVDRISAPPEAHGNGAELALADAASAPVAADADVARAADAVRATPELADPLSAEADRAAAPDPEADRGPKVAIEGRVMSANGCPRDAETVVYAFTAELDVEDALRVLAAANPGDANTSVEEPARARSRSILGRAPLTADGSFRLEVPERARTAHVLAIGRSWFGLETTPFNTAEASKRLDLTVECGGWIRGTATAPAGHAVAELEDLEIRLETGISGLSGDMRNFRGANRRAKVHDGHFEFPALEGGKEYAVSASPDALASAKLASVAVETGRATDVELAFPVGGTVRGIVRSTDGAAIADAKVTANEKGRWFGFDDKAVRTDTTKADGSFELVGVALGSVDLKATADGWLLEKQTKVDVVDRVVTEGIELVLGRGATISGTVHWSDGRAAADLAVSVAFDRSQMAGMGAFNMLKGAHGETQTDAEGRFAVTGLGPGPFVVEAGAIPPAEERELEGLKSKTKETVFVNPVSGERSRLGGLSAEIRRQYEHRARVELVKPGTEGLDLVLRPPTGLRGSVIDLAGAPVTTFKIHVHGVGSGLLAEVGQEEFEQEFEAETGTFILKGLHDGKWRMYATSKEYAASAPIEITAPTADGAPPIEIRMERAAFVHGFVVAPDGTRVTEAKITIEDGNPAWKRALSGVTSPEATTDAEGRFELGPLRPGSTSIVAEHEGHARSTVVTLELAAGQTVEEVALTLTVGGRITGEVFHLGQPAPGMLVQVQEMKRFSQHMEHTDADGRFVAEHLDPGTYQVVAMMTSSLGMVGEEGELDASSMLANMKMATAEVTEGSDVHLVLGAPPEDPIVVKGRVMMAGDPVPSAMVMFLPEGAKKGSSALKFIQTKKDGTYTVTLDGPGGYSVSVQRMSAQMDGQSVHEERHILPKTAEFELDITLPEGRISGRVLGQDGQPSVNARVSIVHEGVGAPGTMWGGQFHEMHTNADGEYDATGIAPGTYTVLAGGSDLGGMLGDGAASGGRETRSGIVVGETDWRRGVDFRLKAPAVVNVTVVDASGHAVSGAVIFARDEAGRSMDVFSFVTSDGAGLAKYSGLAAGRYTFRARTGTIASGESSPVRVDAGGKGEVRIVLEKGTLVLVKVVDGDKNPVVASVEVVDENGHDVARQLGMSEVMERMQGGGDFDPGEHKFGPFAPGKYKVRVTSTSGKVESKPVNLSGQAERKVTIEIE